MEINGIRISMDLVENMKLKESLNASIHMQIKRH